MYLCRRMKLCGFLLKKGFNYEKIIADKYNPRCTNQIDKSSTSIEVKNIIFYLLLCIIYTVKVPAKKCCSF